DVYLKDVGDEGIYGYASTDPGQSGRTRFAYLVLDNDYAPSQFPGYTDPLQPMQVTAAHEYNHVLQYAYDTLQDTWMFESTATWSEDKVFDAVNDYVFYLDSWAHEPDEPITSPGDGSPVPTSDDDLKMYGSAIWNHWIDAIYGPQVVRRAWELSVANTVAGGGFAPRAYDAAIKEAGGPGFAAELETFSVATAFWETANSGIHEGASFGTEVARRGTLSPGTAGVTGLLDHTAFAIYDVPVPTGTSQLNLEGGLPAGTTGAIALIGTDGTNQDRTVAPLDADGRVTLSMSDPGRFSRIKAVVVNTDTSASGFGLDDWNWTKDAQAYSLTATTGAVTVTPTPTPTQTVTPPPPPPPPPPAATLTLTRSSTKLPFVARKGVLALFARVNKAGRLTAKATVDRATASRLKVGRRTTTAGTGSRTATAAARLKVDIRLTKKVRAALKRQKKRSVLVKVRVTFVPGDGTAAVTKTISIRLRP
ncbi:MAG TPA: MXAN_6640 family putative metalloprotease, partial [Solirubrobacteraceae bacterium]|nr:MXAN_6640 family putative metalloprotease [Solirubrobacteraceae bacterium]